VEILLTPRGDGLNFKKQVKINGVPRRNVDLVGLLRAVLFLPEDIKLVDGAPGERRRYLDVALCQIDRSYMRSLAQCQKVVEQRNSLLKTLRERGVRPNAPEVDAQLGFWDDQLVQHGSAVIAARYRFLCELEPSAQARHAELSDGRERLTLVYLPSFNPGHLSDIDFAHLENDQFAEEIAGQTRQPLSAATAAVRFRDKLRSRRAREIDAGATLYGPQRDDLRFLANGRDLRLYGSRGQQRSAALSLKLAEVQAMTQRTGAPPLLLLDDVMSELDAGRRRMLLTALEGVEQAILTTTDWEDYTPEFRARARCIYVAGGGLRPMENNPF
jgi:DNA replication and repair protein RecF